ncbi:50S ribosomal protein L17 [Candidatus Shapirobacteria bacterium CG03_land_8_20_14_0_80_40_19]|uniref:Large ribosomal subunit protein bL17 n=3 Tax=Candidatus Shapironibacteriota TaxID=1752721 RepID=A0A2M7BE15_9BACT|nr:MAG: 50S ribosomal protein L17 [Candidatus Shapirobacteria bacterium CG11_big_fil_rev_8_21_14_0_20_40_12]PIV01341.1 MAG: 50S ribosomal protein L17 [Candidatus Shapirobacteria bacterium CG03_land_8_20_14_0_80_40_19]PJC76676.1 MAG: 50S ribosomal protein L17 [Candidatus Shapirobacteria bacterium CG_4_8_14_3_um_filter_39_11]
MRKKVFGYQLNRDKNERKALFRSLVSSLIEKNEIQTTLAKAKAIQSQTEKLITKAKKGTLSDRRVARRFLVKKDLVNRLFEVIAPIFKDRNGGYTRIIKTQIRRGDGATLVKISFTEEIPVVEREKKKPAPEVKTKKTHDKTN